MNEKLLPLLEAVELAIGQTPHPQTCRRWIKSGIRGVRLQASFINGAYLVSVDAVQRFIEQSTAVRLETIEPPKVEIVKPVKPGRVNRAIEEFNKLAKAK
jgi:hypothetical protein